MAYLPETPQWGAGIYQLESTDPAGGGPNGILNLPLKAIANRLAFLKQFSDEMEDAKGDFDSLLDRMESFTPIDIQSQNANMGAILEAIGLAGIANQEIQKERTQRKQTGTILLTNKGIINGCAVTKSSSAARNLSCARGTVFAGGQLFPFFGEENGAAVPSNEGQTEKTCYAYLYFDADGTLEFSVTPLDQMVPSNGIPLYMVTVPAGNNEQNDSNLSNVVLSSVQRIESNFPAFYNNPLYANVSLPFPLPDADYAISLDVISITGSISQRGEIYPMDRNVNGFKICYNGIADDLLILWEISKPSL
jgi:hypothetical protein